MKPHARIRRRGAMLLALRVLAGVVFLSVSSPSSRSQTAELPEYQLKAAFLYNFAKFINWPTNAYAASNSPLVLAVIGEDPFGPTLEQTLAGKVVNGHPIQLVRVGPGLTPPNCHILFVARSERERLDSILSSVATKSVLTVGDFDRFAHEGGMINLFLEAKAVRFEINVNATERAGFKVNPRLGGLGKMVRGRVVNPGGGQ